MNTNKLLFTVFIIIIIVETVSINYLLTNQSSKVTNNPVVKTQKVQTTINSAPILFQKSWEYIQANYQKFESMIRINTTNLTLEGEITNITKDQITIAPPNNINPLKSISFKSNQFSNKIVYMVQTGTLDKPVTKKITYESFKPKDKVNIALTIEGYTGQLTVQAIIKLNSIK